MRLPDHVTLTPAGPIPGDDSSEYGGAVLLDERSGRYWHLNPTAHLLLATLLEGATTAEAARALTAVHPAAAGRVEADTRRLIEALAGAGLLEHR